MNNVFILDECAIIALLAGEKGAENVKKLREFPVEVIVGLNENSFNEAGRIKSNYRIPLGDSIAVAECIINNGTLVTSDHNDLGIIEKINIYWFR